jgi:mRNA-degrading endonuclease RelE of RelBE toxin-antitoxin system
MSRNRKRPSGDPGATARETPRLPGAFELRFTEDAAKEIRGLDGSIKKQLQKALANKLTVNPEGYGLPLRGPLAGYWKHEFADHRIIYRVYPDQPAVVICAVGPRKEGDTQDVYNRLISVAKTGRLAEQLAGVLEKLLFRKK